MKLKKVKIENYKGLKNTECTLSDFVCVVGENNAGKSSLLQAILLFINGTKLSEDKYYNSQKEILITIEMDNVSNELLENLGSDHRQKLKAYVKDEKLTLARRYSINGTSKLRIVTDVPKNTKFRQNEVRDAFAGKKGKEIAEVLEKVYPETGDIEMFSSIKTQNSAKLLIEEYVTNLPADELELDDIELPTGFDNSIRAILPEPIYIPAVKDLIDDLKTKEGATFGRLLSILLNVIEEDLTEATETFENLKKKLTRVVNEDGTITDDRMDRIKNIEDTIQRNLKETFRDVNVELEIPPPDIKSILSNASVVADDGVKGPVDNKGDGFKRAITFSILRTYVQVSQDKKWRKDPHDAKPVRDRFLFLFEEPELYLHPRAQNILFDALSLISKRYQTIVTTHSPLFFSSDHTVTFAKIYKSESSESKKPIGICSHVDISNLSERDKFQLISFESSNQAFFSRHIVLVEGDSELIVFPHIARLLNPKWDFRTTSTNLIKSNGKGSFQRYREFFERFEVDVSMIADLDTLLHGFNKLGANQKAKNIREDLIVMIDRIIDEENLKPDPSSRLIKQEIQKNRFSKKLEELNQARSNQDHELVVDLLNEIFLFELSKPRYEVLSDHNRTEVLNKKRELITELRRNNIYILEKGEIEAYYPPSVTGSDKPSKAQSFCKYVDSPCVVNSLCDSIDVEGQPKSEFETLFSGIFMSR